MLMMMHLFVLQKVDEELLMDGLEAQLHECSL